jgi:hypothetical protein
MGTGTTLAGGKLQAKTAGCKIEWYRLGDSLVSRGTNGGADDAET